VAGFLYFVPGVFKTSFSPEELATLKIAHAFDAGTSQSCREYRGTGPGGESGTIVADSNTVPAERHVYSADKQTWRKAPASSVRVGMWNDAKPGPPDTVRKAAIPGHAVTLGDGRQWMIPVARGIAETPSGDVIRYTNCDRRLDWDDEGRRVLGEVVEAHKALWDAASLWMDAKTQTEGDDHAAMLEQVETTEAAVVGLSTNYRVGLAEVGLLGLLTERTEWTILDAMIDWPSWLTWLKKKEASDTSNSDAGPLDATQAIAQA
jgi:hypothetical protein